MLRHCEAGRRRLLRLNRENCTKALMGKLPKARLRFALSLAMTAP